MTEKSKKIAFCITCMNRLHHLQKTLEKNIQDNFLPDVVEFVLLNYNSKDGLETWVTDNMQQYIDNGILIYYKTTEPQHYHRSHSRNMVFRLAKSEIVCNLDADNFLGEDFATFMINEFEKEKNIFYISDLFNSDVYGRVCVKKSDFELIGGYDEALQGYGCEDDDFFNRLRDAGVTQKHFGNPNYYGCIKHSDEERIKDEFMTLNTEKIYITYINPYASGILLLYRDFTFSHSIIVDSPHLYYRLQSSFSNEYNANAKDVTLKKATQNGNWQLVDNVIKIESDFFNINDENVQFQKQDYYLVKDSELKFKLFVMLNLAANHYTVRHRQQHEKTYLINNFGRGNVFKNFDMNQAIVLS